MNHCRICNKIIPDRFNGGPALRCSRCRKIQDEQLSEMIAETSGLDEENEYLRSRFFDTETEYQKLNRKHQKMKKRYDILRGKHCSDLKKIDNLETENERLRKGIERLFARIHVLEGRNAEGLKDYKQLKSEILSDEQSNDEEERAKRL